MTDNLDALRHIEGFPIGEDEDILALSDPPHYTAYPNPHIAEFIAQHGKPYNVSTDDYQCEPYVENEVFGRTDDVYNCHSYHTKVPPQAIQKYIRHYTGPGEVVLDVFAGTGMTGVAAQRENRRAVLVDLSPLATFIASNNCSLVDSDQLLRTGMEIVAKVRAEYGYLYTTQHRGSQRGQVTYTIWSDLVACPYCDQHSRYWDLWHRTPQAVRNKKRNQTYVVCDCGAEIESGDLQFVLNDAGQKQQVPVRISYRIGNKRFLKEPDDGDKDVLATLDTSFIAHWYPADAFMFIGNQWGDQWRGYHVGIETVADFYMKRNLMVLAAVFEGISTVTDPALRRKLLYVFTATLPRVNRLNRYMPEHNRHVGPLSGTLYVSKLPVEINVLENFADKLREISRARFYASDAVVISTQSASDLSGIETDTVDYIFTDPPFGDNLPYAELNFMSEAWLRVFTNTTSETIVSRAQDKDLDTYRQMMLRAFQECYRVLKPGRWITVEFHNSKAAVWNAIQDSLARAGFVVAQVVVLDKKKGTTKQLSYPGTVAKDLIINAYKPRKDFTQRVTASVGIGQERSFVLNHLAMLGSTATIERRREMLYSKLLAYYVQHGYQIQYNADQFYRLLDREFPEADGYYFRDEAQRGEYEARKLKLKQKELTQAPIFVLDERSALQWLWHFLDHPRTYSDIYTAYVKALQAREDEIPELRTLLDENFVRTNGDYRRPDVATKQELEQKRQARLLREFDDYLLQARAGRKLKDVRKEAVIAGFTQAYRQQRFSDILTVGRKLDKKLVEASTEIFDFMDIAEAKVER